MIPPLPAQHQHGDVRVSWEVQKDITRYSSLLERSNLSLTLMALSMSRNESFLASPSPYQSRKVGSLHLDPSSMPSIATGVVEIIGEGDLKYL